MGKDKEIENKETDRNGRFFVSILWGYKIKTPDDVHQEFCYYFLRIRV